MRDTVTDVPAEIRVAPAAAILGVSLATIAAVWWLQMRGYAPCELCLKERVPYYLAAVLSGAMVLGAGRLPPGLLRAGYAGLVLLWMASIALGLYHAGVEWKLWAGPTECSGAAAAPAAVSDFLKQLKSVTVVRCDEAALAVAGLSLAAWNAALSAVLAFVALSGWRRGSSD